MEILLWVTAMPVQTIHKSGPNNPQIFEITRDKKVVWEFNEFELVGNGLACWQVLDGKKAKALRSQLAALR